MIKAQPTYYDLLGVAPSASQDTVKKRYRELARKYHPDINPLPEAAQQIKTINEAYHTLGDPEKRLVYDADLTLKRKAVEDREAVKVKSTPQNYPPRQSQRQTPTRSAGYNGFGTTPPDQSSDDSRHRSASTHSPNNSSANSSSRKTTSAFNAADRLLTEAKLAYINHQYVTSENLCQQALQIDRRNAVAYEILGDIYLKKRQPDRAGTAYSYAIQFNPRNYSVQAKLESLGSIGVKPNHAPPSQHNILAANAWRLPINFEREISGIVLTVILAAILLGSGVVIWFAPGKEVFPEFLIYFLPAAALGVAAGGLMALYAGLRPLASELFQRERRNDGQPMNANIGGILILSSLIWFYASLLIYIGIAAPRSRLSSSVLRIYGCVILLSLLCALIYHAQYESSSIMVAALSGNILFPSCLLGWALGDSFRLRN